MKLPVLILGVLLVAGCNKAPSLVGKWQGKVDEQDATIQFAEDGSLTLEAKKASTTVSLKGKYKIKAKKMTMLLKEITVKGASVTAEPLIKNAFKVSAARLEAVDFQFNNPDELALTAKGKTDVLKRIAEE